MSIVCMIIVVLSLSQLFKQEPLILCAFVGIVFKAVFLQQTQLLECKTCLRKEHKNVGSNKEPIFFWRKSRISWYIVKNFSVYNKLCSKNSQKFKFEFEIKISQWIVKVSKFDIARNFLQLLSRYWLQMTSKYN